jgi:SAM-dependent methyltransferase
VTDHDRGQIDTSATEIYDGLFVPALFGRFVEPIADASAIGAADSVVDVACGTGALTRALASRTTGRVIGVDINPAMVAVAGRRSGDIEYHAGDGMDLAFDDGAFDLATCQFGLMFYPDPARGIAEMARVAGQGAVAVWDSIDRSEGYTAMQQLFRSELGDDAAASLNAPFAMGSAGTLESLFAEAGVSGVRYTTIEGSGRFASIDEWVTTEVRGWTLGDAVSDEQLADLIEVAQDRLAQFATADGCVFGMAARLATWGT